MWFPHLKVQRHSTRHNVPVLWIPQSALYCLTHIDIAYRVKLGCEARRLSHLLRFLTLPRVTDSSVSTARGSLNSCMPCVMVC